MRREEPDRFATLIACMRAEVSRANAIEDRPLTEDEVDEMVDRTARDLGWSRARVIADGVLRLRAELGEGFRPVTPENKPRRRRTSSMRALVVGDLDALLEKHKRERKPAR